MRFLTLQKRFTPLLLIPLLLTGCAASGFQEHYKPVAVQSTTNDYAVHTCPPPHEPQVQKITFAFNVQEHIARMFQKGYTLIGEAHWEGRDWESLDEALEQGKAVNACFVLWGKKHTGEKLETVAVQNYIPSESKTIIRDDGETEEIYIPSHYETDYVPEMVSYYQYVGLFFAKAQLLPHSLGVQTAPSPLSYMRAADSRGGMLVTGVIVNSPAYEATIFEGDIIIKVNNTPVSYPEKLPVQVGQVNSITIYRDGKVLIKEIPL